MLCRTESERNLLRRGLRATAAGRNDVLARLHSAEHVHDRQPLKLLQMRSCDARLRRRRRPRVNPAARRRSSWEINKKKRTNDNIITYDVHARVVRYDNRNRRIFKKRKHYHTRLTTCTAIIVILCVLRYVVHHHIIIIIIISETD